MCNQCHNKLMKNLDVSSTTEFTLVSETVGFKTRGVVFDGIKGTAAELLYEVHRIAHEEFDGDEGFLWEDLHLIS